MAHLCGQGKSLYRRQGRCGLRDKKKCRCESSETGFYNKHMTPQG